MVTKSEVVGLMSVRLVSKISNLCDHNPPTSQTDGRTDGRHAIARPRSALRGNNNNTIAARMVGLIRPVPPNQANIETQGDPSDKQIRQTKTSDSGVTALTTHVAGLLFRLISLSGQCLSSHRYGRGVARVHTVQLIMQRSYRRLLESRYS